MYPVRHRPSQDPAGRLGATRSAHRPLLALLLLAALGSAVLAPAPAHAQATNPFVGEIIMMAGPIVPNGWIPCDGRLLPITQYSVLFNLIGTTFGGDGQSNFAVPDLRGRVPLGIGQGPGLSNYAMGQNGGVESVALTLAQMPAHSHQLLADSTVAVTDRPGNRIPARNAAGLPVYGTTGNTFMGPAVGMTGGGQPHENRQPFLAVQYLIAYLGVFPTAQP